MPYPLQAVVGLGPASRAKLESLSIKSTGALLERCRTREGRERIQKATGLSPELLLRWTLAADLLRLEELDAQQRELLRAAGIDSVAELRHRAPSPLAERIAEVNGLLAITQTTPDVDDVTRWIRRAERLAPTIVC